MASKVVWNPIREKTDVERELRQDEQPLTERERLARRWEAAEAKARADRIVVAGSPGWWRTCYFRDGERVEHWVRQDDDDAPMRCDCAAGADPDGICKHRAAVHLHVDGQRARRERERYERDRRAWLANDAETGAEPYPDPPAEVRPGWERRPKPRIAWTNAPAGDKRAQVRDHIDEARAQMGYLLHFTDLPPTAADSVKRALLALNRAYNAS